MTYFLRPTSTMVSGITERISLQTSVDRPASQTRLHLHFRASILGDVHSVVTVVSERVCHVAVGHRCLCTAGELRPVVPLQTLRNDVVYSPRRKYNTYKTIQEHCI